MRYMGSALADSIYHDLIFFGVTAYIPKPLGALESFMLLGWLIRILFVRIFILLSFSSLCLNFG